MADEIAYIFYEPYEFVGTDADVLPEEVMLGYITLAEESGALEPDTRLKVNGRVTMKKVAEDVGIV